MSSRGAMHLLSISPGRAAKNSPKLTGHDSNKSYNRRPEDLSDQVAPTVGAIVEITGKSMSTMFSTISLLKLSDEIRTAIRNEGG